MQKYAHLVELEKCCQKHIFLQNFVLIQPRTSPPKICKFKILQKCLSLQILLIPNNHADFDRRYSRHSEAAKEPRLNVRLESLGPKCAHVNAFITFLCFQNLCTAVESRANTLIKRFVGRIFSGHFGEFSTF